MDEVAVVLDSEIDVVGAEAPGGGERPLPPAGLSALGRAPHEEVHPLTDQRRHRDPAFGGQSLELSHLRVGDLNLRTNHGGPPPMSSFSRL